MAERKVQAMRIMTRPQDWAAPARAHLFGLHTLSAEEAAREVTRMSGGRPAYSEAARRKYAR